MKFKEKLESLTKFTLDFLHAGWLVFLLVWLFALQNDFFNLSLDIFPERYFIRRTVISLALGTLIFGPAILMKRRAKYCYLFITSILFSFILFCQYLFYTYSGGFLQASALFYAGEGLAILDTVKALLTYKLFIFAVGPILILASWLTKKRYAFLEKYLLKKQKLGAGLLILFFVIAGYGYVVIKEKMESGTIAPLYKYSVSYDLNSLISKINVVNYSLVDLLTLATRTETVNAADTELVNVWLNSNETKTLPKNFGLAKNRNLIIIQVESLENAVINQKINGQEITPQLNELTHTGLYFNNYYAPIGPGNTADTEFVTLNSLYALPNEVAFINYAYDNYQALPKLLKNNGYDTYAFHGDVPSFWNRANIYPSLGYDKMFGRDDYKISREIGPFGLGDEDFFTQSLPHLKTLPQPFLATLITLSSHVPFELPEDLETLNISENSNLNWWQYHYLQSIHYADKTIGNFIDTLKQNNLYNNSLIVIIGDHGSNTNISRALNISASPFGDLTGTQVPFVILLPNTKFQGTISQPASHLDFYPTLANLLGLKITTKTIMGKDLLNTKEFAVIHRNSVSGTIRSIITNTLAYHSSADGIFEHGECLQMPKQVQIDTQNCAEIFKRKNNEIKISDLLIRGNLFK